jgi:prepilin-type N-terminal cleavage/methylation domain-containing protein/prepilin-type processing-associated H-X9-DG protein
MKTRKSAFTLIELLVVISIIALLVSILLPALSSARDQARMAVCSVHLSGIGKAVAMYTNDSKDLLPSPGVHPSGPNKGQLIQGSGLNRQTFCNYYTYCDYSGNLDNAGPCEFGCLFLAGVLENSSDVIFCPSFCNPMYGTYNGQRRVQANNNKNAKGNPNHENYTGVNAANNSRMTPADEAKIGWLNGRASYGFRPMVNTPIWTAANISIKKTSQTKSNMSYVSDVWENNGGYWHIHIDEISHVSKGSTEAKMHAWYFDGHVERKNFSRDKYFVSAGINSPLPPSEGGFMNQNPALTWRVLFDDGIDYLTGMPYMFP